VRNRVDLPTLRAAWWATLALGQARRALRRGGLHAIAIASPPPLPPRAERGVLAMLRRLPHTCLERALVLQRWQAAHGKARDVIIAVKGPSREFEAHAWLDGEPDGDVQDFEELLRLPAR
jgi:hypothetical protein